jgi:pSer/pThr/pTyr-binding forkhead associated (FHA) protein
MVRFFLRHLDTQIPLAPGSFVIGRSDSCDLPIDDGLISRRHAALRVDTDWVVLEDLGSRNGVFVNGTCLTTPRQLRHGDKLKVGLQELYLIEEGARRKPRTVTAAAAPAAAPSRARREDETDEVPITERLSRREREVLALVAQGYTHKQVAEQLGVSEKTVESHRSRLCLKLGVRDRSELFRVAVRIGLLSRTD